MTSITLFPSFFNLFAIWIHFAANIYIPTEDRFPILGWLTFIFGLNLVGILANDIVRYFEAALIDAFIKSLGLELK
jgi:hypothetical protein